MKSEDLNVLGFNVRFAMITNFDKILNTWFMELCNVGFSKCYIRLKLVRFPKIILLIVVLILKFEVPIIPKDLFVVVI